MPPGGGFILMVVMVAMPMLVMMRVPMLVSMFMMVVIIVIRHGMGGFFATQKAQERAAFDPQQAEADQHDQGIADDLDCTNRIAHRLGGRAEERGRNADDRDRGECLKKSRSKRQHNAAPPGFVVGDEVR